MHATKVKFVKQCVLDTLIELSVTIIRFFPMGNLPLIRIKIPYLYKVIGFQGSLLVIFVCLPTEERWQFEHRKV